MLLSPYVPLLFMGEEYGETAPFQYFVSHSDPALVEAVRRGRREEFAGFAWQGELPDPQDEATFLRCTLDHGLRGKGHHRVLLEFYAELIGLRKAVPALASLSREQMKVTGYEKEEVLLLQRWSDDSEVFAVFSFGDKPASLVLPVPRGQWRKLLDSAHKRWEGIGTSLPDTLYSEGEARLTLSASAVVLFVREAQP